PAPPAFFRAMVCVVVIVIVCGRWYVTGGNATHAWLLPAGPSPVETGRILVILLLVPCGGRLALGRDIRGLDDGVRPLAVVPPGVAGVGNDRSDLYVVEQIAERCHGGAWTAVQHDVDLTLHGREHGCLITR